MSPHTIAPVKYDECIVLILEQYFVFCLDMKRIFPLLLLLPIISATGKTVFLSPTGSDDATGVSPKVPLRSIANALSLVDPGDTIALLPGIYPGRNVLDGRHGSPDLPITIRSHSKNPLHFSIIDGGSAPSSSTAHEGFVFRDCSWINIEHLIFRNCWTHVIQIFDSPYISIRGCHFSTGKRVIHAVGHGTHHTLVEHCYIKHPEGVWRGWSWESLHHGEVGYYNGALLHPKESGGGHIMRYNTIVNVFNAFRTRPTSIAEDGNIEIYGNSMINIRDNEFEPESFAWNMHYYNNDHINVHKMFSIDGVEGGNIYIYGNTYTQTDAPWALEEVSGIFKYKNGPITSPCYAFNNSYYTEAKVLRWGESTNHHLKHFNNAYEFFQGKANFRLATWQPGFEFDYDCINQSWPAVIGENWQEQHGLALTDPKFVNGSIGDFRLKEDSPCRDAGRVMQLPEFDWIQSYTGAAPDIGAYEGENRIDGPAFRFMPSAEGAHYQERPRISRYKIRGKQLHLYFSAPLNPATVQSENISLYSNRTEIQIDTLAFPLNHYELWICTDQVLADKDLALQWLRRPHGENGLPLTDWATCLGSNPDRTNVTDLSGIPIPYDARNDIPAFKNVRIQVNPPKGDIPRTFRIVFDYKPDMKFVNHMSIHSPEMGELTFAYEPVVIGNEVHFQHPEKPLSPGKYIARSRVGKMIIETEFMVEK